MRQKIAAGNWKMNTDYKQGLSLTKEIIKASRSDEVLTILGVPYTHAKDVGDLCRYVSNIEMAVQNVHDKESGAYTGEISAPMAKSIGATYVIIGHSERRMYQQESNALLATKLNVALNHHLKPIFCCGEPLSIRKKKQEKDYVKKQLKEGLFHLTKREITKCVIAYEPIWAIGTGETATPEQAQSMHSMIRSELAAKYGKALANRISILYGGSVKPTNSKELFSQQDIDGGLVGGASLKGKDFVSIINSF